MILIIFFSNFHKKYKKLSQKIWRYKKRLYLCGTNVGFSHLLINLTNLTSDIRQFPRLPDIVFLMGIKG